MKQSIRLTRSPDGFTLAWAEAGTGPALIKAANWLTHLEYDWDSPVWRHWMRFFADYFRFIRYDERGCGMTEWDVPELDAAHWDTDLETVIEVARPEKPFALLLAQVSFELDLLFDDVDHACVFVAVLAILGVDAVVPKGDPD